MPEKINDRFKKEIHEVYIFKRLPKRKISRIAFPKSDFKKEK